MTSPLANPVIRDSAVPLTVEQYQRMGQAGIIGQRTELIRGVIVQKVNKSPLHTLTVRQLIDAIQVDLPNGYEVRKEEPLTLSQSEPEPDIAIVEEGSYEPGTCHPFTAALVVEVAITSEAMDRVKTAIYAEAAVWEYWLVLPEKRTVERFSDPLDGNYRRHDIYNFDEHLEAGTPLELNVDLTRLAPPR